MKSFALGSLGLGAVLTALFLLDSSVAVAAKTAMGVSFFLVAAIVFAILSRSDSSSSRD